ncbi:MAG: hypothetical protein UIM24_00015 [Clostridia bacterium]|nr:hypothetical protein [Clostridia bacterium]
MKKYLSGLFVMLSMMFLFVSTAFAAEYAYTITDVQFNKGYVHPWTRIKLEKNTNELGGVCIISYYTSDGKLICATTTTEHQVLQSEGSMGTFSISFEGDDSQVAKVKAMIWDNVSSMKPMAESKIGMVVERPKTYAIVEQYVTSTEKPYLSVMTFEGVPLKLFLDSDENNAAQVDAVMKSMGIGEDEKDNAARLPISERVIEYLPKASSKTTLVRIKKVETVPFEESYYDVYDNVLEKPLCTDVTIMSATKYSLENPSVNNYMMVSITWLVQDIDYAGFLFGKNENGEYCNAVITREGRIYNDDSNFAVVASTANPNHTGIFDEETFYRLSAMYDGEIYAKELYILQGANIYIEGESYEYDDYCSAYLKEGAVFYYNTNSNGFVDRIDVVLEGGYDYQTIRSLITEEYETADATIDNLVKLPSSDSISSDTWFVDIDSEDIAATRKEIQLFIAPVLNTGSKTVAFGAVENNNGLYVNTNNQYIFSLSHYANIYSYNLWDAGTKDAFCAGSFEEISIDDTDANGRAWLTNVPANEKDFDELVQFAFVMAVDGEITNALLFNP